MLKAFFILLVFAVVDGKPAVNAQITNTQEECLKLGEEVVKLAREYGSTAVAACIPSPKVKVNEREA
jgi:hypothetical protein